MLSLAELKKAGFKKSATFELLEGNVTLSGSLPNDPGIYLFVIGGEVRYVGKTDRSLHSRLRAYEKRLRKDLPRRQVHEGILGSIERKEIVDVYTLTITGRRFFQRDSLPVDYLVGLEAGLIENLDHPHWNPFNSVGRAKRAKLLNA
jgi:hypothetical protein